MSICRSDRVSVTTPPHPFPTELRLLILLSKQYCEIVLFCLFKQISNNSFLDFGTLELKPLNVLYIHVDCVL